MLKFLVLSLVLVSVDGCCTPMQWEMDGGKITSRPLGPELGLALTNCKFHYDAINFRIAMTTGIFRDPNFKNRTIWDYEKRLMYQIDEIHGTCDVMTLDQPFKEICTPEGARVADHFFYGGGDQGTLPAATFEYDFPEYSGFVDVTEGTQSSDTCVPIVSVNYNRSFMTSMTFMNIVKGIRDPSVFEPPEVCESAFRKALDSRMRVHPYLRVPLKL